MESTGQGRTRVASNGWNCCNGWKRTGYPCKPYRIPRLVAGLTPHLPGTSLGQGASLQSSRKQKSKHSFTTNITCSHVLLRSSPPSLLQPYADLCIFLGVASAHGLRTAMDALSLAIGCPCSTGCLALKNPSSLLCGRLDVSVNGWSDCFHPYRRRLREPLVEIFVQDGWCFWKRIFSYVVVRLASSCSWRMKGCGCDLRAKEVPNWRVHRGFV